MPEPRTIRFDTLVAPHMDMLLRVLHNRFIDLARRETHAALELLIGVANALRAENYARGLEGVSVMGIRQTAHSLISMRYEGHPKARAVVEGLARNGDALERLMAESRLRLMDMKADMEKARQNPQPALPAQ
jgi:hypothetical protein